LHGLAALRKATQEDDELSNKNVEIAIVGLDEDF